MARQVGTVLGVAGLVAVLAHLSPVDPLPGYRHAVVLIIAFFLGAGTIAALFLTGRPAATPAPARSSARA
ncbi:MAG TPA: hypothetical protein VG295_05180, partial [Solirubrobacteraceae bacterium]|nr:hypothetical protein [Solirubrobacteraceae bacterium]